MLYIMIQRARRETAQEDAEKKLEWEKELKSEDKEHES